MNKALEDQIREILAAENDAISLSDKLFSPHGLFSQMAKTEAERREIACSPLFKEAQGCLSRLQRKEADEFARKLQESPDLAEPRLLKLERS